MVKYDANRIKELFSFDSFRAYQEEIMKDICNGFNGDVDVFLLGAPVGFGKSPVGIWAGRSTSLKDMNYPDAPFGAYYTTPQKLLQDQLLKDFSQYIKVIKGRNAYSCQVIGGNTCKDGKCQYDENYECEQMCPYREARELASNAQIACSNFSYSMVVPERYFGKRELLIVDEAHSCADWALNYVSTTIYAKDLSVPIPDYPSFEQYIEWLAQVKEKFNNDYLVVKNQLDEANGRGDIVLGLKERRD
ncbi:MAG: DEAD/DEAH box helicase, partial [Ignavibacteria bacterium]|nr:DEAD/DEAH box helicase [Ignavibacteria bacterium]